MLIVKASASLETSKMSNASNGTTRPPLDIWTAADQEARARLAEARERSEAAQNEYQKALERYRTSLRNYRIALARLVVWVVLCVCSIISLAVLLVRPGPHPYSIPVNVAILLAMGVTWRMK
jgi:hypothetical protein